MSVLPHIDLRLERLRSEHIPVLLAIEQEAYPDPWTSGMFEQEITNATSRFYVAYAGSEITGYAGYWLVFEEVHITKVTVAQPHRNRGLGCALLSELLDISFREGGRIARLEVRESNLPARRLYERLGFTLVGVRKDYYARSREAAIVMVKELSEANGNSEDDSV